MKPFNPDLKADLTAIGGIYTIIIVLSMWIHSNYKLQHELTQLKADYFQAKVLVVELDSTNTSLHEALISLNKSYDEVESKANYFQKLSGLKEDLRSYSLEDQATGYALGWTETEWNYYATHNSAARGICGVMPLWDDYLHDLGIKPNSIEACIAIYNFYLDQTGSNTKAVKNYKGIESKKYEWLIKHTLYLRQYILKRLKEQ